MHLWNRLVGFAATGALRLVGAGIALAVLALGAPPAEAHLSIIRQGPESAATASVNNFYGSAVAAGDFDGDGVEDLAVGAPLDDVNSHPDAGCVIVNWGSPLGLTHVGAVLLDEDDHSGSANSHSFGDALAAGDFNGDGRDDLVVGVPGHDGSGGGTNVGRAHVYRGTAAGLVAWHTLTQGTAGGSEESQDAFASCLAVGDLDGDGIDDLVVGGPGEDSNAGTIFWFLGSGPSGLLSGNDGWIKQSSVGGTNTADDLFGHSIAVGNIIGDSRDDIAVGAPLKEVSVTVDAGEVTVIPGGASGPVLASAVVYNSASGDLGFVVGAGTRFGYALAIGKFRAGSYESLAVGEPYFDSAGIQDAGRVGVGLGGVSGVDWVGAEMTVLLESEAGGTVSTGDRFGTVLAAGRFETLGSYDELAVGSPSDDVGLGLTAVGSVSGFYGGVNGLSEHGWFGFNQETCNDPCEANDRFGTALCFGRFDDTGKGTLVVGANGEDSNKGCVHVIAPWRQRYNLDCNTALITDCEGNWVYSQKPFDEVCIASTTKTMTVLIAAERSQLPTSHPKYVSLDAEYQVKDWIRYNVNGSRYEFWYQERMTLRDLLYACMYPSGNDASYAIADLLTGGDNDWGGSIPSTCVGFVDEMNARAAALGMNDTYFTNPAGLDAGGPYSTAEDMALLARAAMENDVVAGVVSNTTWTIEMTYWDSSEGARVSGERTVSNGYLRRLREALPDMVGVKGGETPCALKTGLFAANAPAMGTAIGCTFGTDGDLPGQPFRVQGPDLMTLGLAECNYDFAAFSPASLQFQMDFGDLPTLAGAYTGGSGPVEFPSSELGSIEFTLQRTAGLGLTSAELELVRGSEVFFGGGETVNFGASPFNGTSGIAFTNFGEGVATFRVTTSYPGDVAIDFSLDPGESGQIPSWTGIQTGLVLSVENRTGDIAALPIMLGVRESYAFDLNGLGQGNVFLVNVPRNGTVMQDGLSFRLKGTDPAGGSTLYASAHQSGLTVDAPEDLPFADALDPVVLLPATPNPFTHATRLGFQLRAAGAVSLDLFDAQGRRVRSFEQSHVPVGAWHVDWDGTASSGMPVPNGVYFYRLTHDGRSAGDGRVTLVR